MHCRRGHFGEDAADVTGWDVLEQFRRDTVGGGGAHHDVDATEEPLGVGGDSYRVGGIQRAAGQEVRVGAEIGQRLGSGFATFDGPADDHDPGHTGFGEGLRGGEADTGGAADDQGTALGEVPGWRKLVGAHCDS